VFSLGCMHGYMLPRMQRDGEFGQPNLENHLANDGFRDVCIAPHTAVLRSAKLRNSGSLAPRPPLQPFADARYGLAWSWLGLNSSGWRQTPA